MPGRADAKRINKGGTAEDKLLSSFDNQRMTAAFLFYKSGSFYARERPVENRAYFLPKRTDEPPALDKHFILIPSKNYGKRFLATKIEWDVFFTCKSEKSAQRSRVALS